MRQVKVVKLNFKNIEENLLGGARVTVKTLAEEQGVSPMIVRRTLDDHYKDKISYQRGRNGGILITD